MIEIEESSISFLGTGSARLLRQRYDTPKPSSSRVKKRIAQMIIRMWVPARGEATGRGFSGLLKIKVSIVNQICNVYEVFNEVTWCNKPRLSKLLM